MATSPVVGMVQEELLGDMTAETAGKGGGGTGGAE